MKRVMIAMMFFLTVVPARLALADDKNKDVIGNWKVEVNSAPYEYSKSTLTIAEKDGLLSGTVKFDTGNQIAVKTVTLVKDELTLELYVEYNYIKVKAKVAGNKITGTVNTPDGAMPLVATRK